MAGIIKCTILFNGTIRDGRSFGFSETFYRAGASVREPEAVTDALAVLRLGILPDSVTWVGTRFVDPDAPGVTLALARDRDGAYGKTADTPWQALNVRMSSPDGNNCNHYLRGIPDPEITGGGANFTNNFNNRLYSYLTELKTNFWLFKGRQLANFPKLVTSVTAGVVVMTEALSGAALNKQVKFYRTKDDNGDSVRGVKKITAFTNESNFTVAPGMTGHDLHDGKLYLQTFAYHGINVTEKGRIVTKKVGAPFFRLRGRRTATR